jgi:hypothetical protein
MQAVLRRFRTLPPLIPLLPIQLAASSISIDTGELEVAHGDVDIESKREMEDCLGRISRVIGTL